MDGDAGDLLVVKRTQCGNALHDPEPSICAGRTRQRHIQHEVGALTRGAEDAGAHTGFIQGALVVGGRRFWIHSLVLDVTQLLWLWTTQSHRHYGFCMGR